MSTNVYLRGDEVKSLTGFETIARNEKGHRWDEYKIVGTTLYYKDGRWYITLYNIDDKVPAILEGIVEEYSCFCSFSSPAHRINGVYRLGTAVAKVTTGERKGSSVNFFIEIRAEKYDELKELLHQIKVGNIDVDESYEGPQRVGPTRQQLLADNAQLLASVMAHEDHLREALNANKQLQAKLAAISHFRDLLQGRSWRLTTATAVCKSLDGILLGRQ